MGRGKPGPLRRRGTDGSEPDATSQAHAAELMKALEKLAQSGLLAGAPADLKELLKGGKLPADAEALRQLTASLSEILRQNGWTLRGTRQTGQGVWRFDPSGFRSSPFRSGWRWNSRPGRGSRRRRRAAHLGQGIVTLRPFQGAGAAGAPRVPTTGRRSSFCLERRGVGKTQRAVGGQAVRGRCRSERVAPHAGAAPPERRQKIFRSEPHMTGDAGALLAPDRVADGQARIARLVGAAARDPRQGADDRRSGGRALAGARSG